MDNENFLTQVLKENVLYHFDLFPDKDEKEIFSFDGKLKRIEPHSFTFALTTYEGKGKDRHRVPMILRVSIHGKPSIELAPSEGAETENKDKKENNQQ